MFQTCSLTALRQQELTGWDAIVLNDPSGLPDSTHALLQEFVEGGGGVLIGFGASASGGEWPQELAQGLLGFELNQVSGEDLWAIDPLEYQSPIVSIFAGFPDTGLLTTPVFRYWKIREPSPALLVDLAFTNGDPMIVRHRVGDGWVASLLSAPENLAMELPSRERWNSIATWPSFVPLMQRLLVTLLDSSSQRFTLPVGELLSSRCPVPSPSNVEIRGPKGEVTLIATEQDGDSSQSRWFYSHTQHAGIYTASCLDGPKRRQNRDLRLEPERQTKLT